MKRILTIVMVILLLCVPMTAFAEETASPSPEASVTPSAPAETPAPANSPTPSPAASDAPDETPEPFVAPGQLTIDSDKLYKGMNKTYKDGYIPAVKDGKVTIILPLIGKTHSGEVTLTADLGATTDSPFVFGNYSQTAKGGEPYVFSLSIPLASGRINGAYPVTLNASYIDASGSLTTQAFIIYVTITDGKKPVDPNAIQTPEKEMAEKPELFISSCVVDPNAVGGDQEFSVKVKIENIGNIRARNIRLSYGGAAADGGAACIVPVDINNAIHLDNIASEESSEAIFKLKTTPNITSGNQSFYVTLDYADAYGGEYSSTRNFLVAVTQPAEIKYDDITKAVPEKITAGETFSLPANVYNTGKSTLKNVMITVDGAGLFPTAAVFLGDIAPGGTGNGELSVFAGQLSMTSGYTESYGKTNGIYKITYTDEAGEEHTVEMDFSLEIVQPVIETEEEETELTEEPAFQWWVVILVGFAIIAVIIAVIVVTKVTRSAKLR